MFAQPDGRAVKEKQPKALVTILEQIGRRLQAGERDQETLQAWVVVIRPIREVAEKCIPAREGELTKLDQKLTTLGEPANGEPTAVTRERGELQRQKSKAENMLATCKVVLIRAGALLSQIGQLEKALRAEQLLLRGPPITELLQDKRLLPEQWVGQFGEFLREHRLTVSGAQWAGLLFALVVAVGIGLLVRQTLLAWVHRHQWREHLSSDLGRSLLTSLGHYAPHLFASTAAAVFLHFATRDVVPVPAFTVLAYGLPPYFLLLSAIHVFLAPFTPARLFMPVPADVGKTFARALKLFATLALLAYLIFATFIAERLPEPALLLARAAFAIAFFINLGWALWLALRIPGLVRTLWLQLGVLLLLLTATAAELAGFRNLSLFATRALIGTLVALGILVLLGRLLRELFQGLNEGRDAWHRRVRQALALRPGDPVPGLGWTRLIIMTGLWVGFVLAILRIWGMPESTLRELDEYVLEGFTLGSLHINPARIVLAVMSLAVILGLSGWIRSRMRRYWLPRTRMERGAREAAVTMSGYIGIAIAFVVALSIAGFEFTNLAIIAGALSVGIGFGLQNVVNNFVSGLILLFERPVKTGDWIVVGETEGYVKRISIRSTLIQTFDRADVIVPNSDLISNQVTNWMLLEPHGRIRVPVSVAYGSDTEKVRDILLDIAHSHPDVITDGSTPEPRVLFLKFGDSSLDFEVRCHIKNIDMRKIVTSDFNFAIDKAFREHEIEIPFPQRDIHIRDWPAEKQTPSTSPRKTPRKRS
ncbi:MAG: mechanosensitive ion channel family protein [Acidiferrobacterales bacterium]